VCSGPRLVWSVAGLHALAAAGALALPGPAALVVLAGIGLSVFAYVRTARQPLFVHCGRGSATGCPGEEPDGPLQPVRVVPFMGRAVLLLELERARGRRHWAVARGDIGETQYRALLVSAGWPARPADGRRR
jgi:hypothetical protein